MTRPSVGVDAIPVAVVERLLIQEEARLLERTREIGTLRDSLASLSHRVPRLASPTPGRGHDAKDASDLALALGARVKPNRTWLSLVELPDCEGTVGLARDLGATADRAASRRAILPVSVLESPFCLRQMRSRAASGELQRLGVGDSLTFAVVDNTVVMPEGDGYRLVTEPGVVALAVRLFEVTWDGSIEPPGDHHDGAIDAMVLDLLARGLKDEAIGRHLGVSLRTVRRRIAAMMDRFGAGTRFELGVRVAARGVFIPQAPASGPTSEPRWARTRLGAPSQSR